MGVLVRSIGGSSLKQFYFPAARNFLARYTSRRIEEGGCVVKFPTPAWSSTNLLNIAKFVESGLVFAHVRAASDGAVLVGSVNHENTHPFQVNRCSVA